MSSIKAIYIFWLIFVGVFCLFALGMGTAYGSNFGEMFLQAMGIFFLFAGYPLFPYWAYELYLQGKASENLKNKIFLFITSFSLIVFSLLLIFIIFYESRSETYKPTCYIALEEVDCKEKEGCYKTYGEKACYDKYHKLRLQNLNRATCHMEKGEREIPCGTKRLCFEKYGNNCPKYLKENINLIKELENEIGRPKAD